jgi:pimeloyl-ACP methyl ester carboxylesterase
LPSYLIVLIVVLSAIALYVLGCYLLACIYVRPSVKNHAGPPEGFVDEGSMWVSEPLVSPVFVLVHGYGGSQAGWSEVASLLHTRGFGVVIPAMPGHGSRSKEQSGFAVKESEIVVDTVEWVHERVGGEPKVVLVGISMGGAACWLATEKNTAIEAVVSEGSFARLGPATKQWMNRRAKGAHIALYPVTLMARRMSGVDPATVNPVESAAKWGGKSLVIHGEHDALFSTDDARELAEASGGDLWIVEGAGHAHCSSVDLEAYVDRLVGLVQ